ncbi:MAG: FAD-dependent oxidoreductase, partial [Planctomycetia bacterium]
MRLYLAALCAIFGFSSLNAQTYDLVIYGGTSAGISAAIQAARMGKTPLIVEPSQHLGG